MGCGLIDACGQGCLYALVKVEEYARGSIATGRASHVREIKAQELDTDVTQRVIYYSCLLYTSRCV